MPPNVRLSSSSLGNSGKASDSFNTCGAYRRRSRSHHVATQRPLSVGASRASQTAVVSFSS